MWPRKSLEFVDKEKVGASSSCWKVLKHPQGIVDNTFFFFPFYQLLVLSVLVTQKERENIEPLKASTSLFLDYACHLEWLFLDILCLYLVRVSTFVLTVFMFFHHLCLCGLSSFRNPYCFTCSPPCWVLSYNCFTPVILFLFLLCFFSVCMLDTPMLVHFALEKVETRETQYLFFGQARPPLSFPLFLFLYTSSLEWFNIMHTPLACTWTDRQWTR